MKKLTTLALAAGLIVAAAAPASAVDTKVSGHYLFSFQRAQTGFEGVDHEFAAQRFRLGLAFTASENLSGYTEFDAKENWYSNVSNSPTVRLAYMDWMIPGTAAKVRMGKFETGFVTDAFGANSVMGPGAEQTGIKVVAPVADWMTLAAMWARTGAPAAVANPGYDVSAGDNTDIFSAYANMKFDGISINPWVAAAFDQAGMTDHRAKAPATALAGDRQAYWGGVSAALTLFDPLTVKASASVGTHEYEGVADRNGWQVQAIASYKLAFGTPSFGFWYGSGDDKDAQYATQNWLPTTGSGKFAPVSTFTDNVWGLSKGQANGNIMGTWGLKLGLNGVSFLSGLTHDFAVAMYNGTNHDDAAAKASGITNYLTWSDTVYEFDFNTTYQIYKNLAANLELAYVINDLDDQTTKGDDDWRAALHFKYSF